MPAKKKLRTEAEPPTEEISNWIKANDKLIGDTKVTLSSLFANCSIKSFNEQKYCTTAKRVITTGRVVEADWVKFQTALEARNEKSPLWFVQRRVEDLLLEPDGTIGERVESFVIVESPFATLAPRHYILAEPLPDADPEDHVPSCVLNLEEQDVKWNPITKDDGSSINAYILQRKAANLTFSFGAPAAAAPAPAPAAAPAGFGFGFGAAAPSAPAPTGFSFGFGAAASTPAPAPAATTGGFSFGFGATNVSAPASAPTVVAAAVAPSAPARRRIPVEDILFTIWDEERAREMKRLALSGSRIVIEDFKLPGIQKPVKLVMQDDVTEKPEEATAEFVLKKLFARQNDRLNSFDKWMDECPELEPHLLAFLQKTREKMLKSESKVTEAEDGERTYEQLLNEVGPIITSALEAAVNRRKPLHEAQAKILDEILELLKESKMVSKTKCRILKFYPSNTDIPFRPFGKVSGISEEGEEAVCEPPAYRFVNPFTGKSS